MKLYTYEVSFAVEDEVLPADIKDAVGAAIRSYEQNCGNPFFRKILAGLSVGNCKGVKE